MPINADEFYTSNKSGLSSSDEINRRNAISRTYYTMYHKALETGIEVIKFANQGMHQNLVDTMLQTDNFKRAGYILSSSKTLRHIADYELNNNIYLSHTTTMHQNYNNFCDALPEAVLTETSIEVTEVNTEETKVENSPDKAPTLKKRPTLKIVK